MPAVFRESSNCRTPKYFTPIPGACGECGLQLGKLKSKLGTDTPPESVLLVGAPGSTAVRPKVLWISGIAMSIVLTSLLSLGGKPTEIVLGLGLGFPLVFIGILTFAAKRAPQFRKCQGCGRAGLGEKFCPSCGAARV